MKSYTELLERILNEGVRKSPTRKIDPSQPFTTGNECVEDWTLMLPNLVWQHNMEDGFPMLTTRPMPWKAVRVELEGFIGGHTSKKWYQERGCNYWNAWAPPALVPSREPTEMKECDELGPIYGAQWRNFAGSGYDQLRAVANTLREFPNDRRMVVSAWSPGQLKDMALPPCHFCFNLVVSEDKLNLWWGQRSCDMPIGIPADMVFYGLLLELLAKHAGLGVGNLTGMLGDCHIYSRQVPGVIDLLGRTPGALCPLWTNGCLEEPFDIFKWTSVDSSLPDRRLTPENSKKIDFGKVVV